MTDTQTESRDYSYIEAFYKAHHSDRDHLWYQIRQDDELLLLFKSLNLTSVGGCLERNEIPVLLAMLNEITSQPESRFPDLHRRSVQLLHNIEEGQI